jgi:hypothetical protein
MDQPGWRRLPAELAARRVSAIVVWRLDRLGRTSSGLTKLFDELVAQFETEVRGERVRAGMAKRWPMASGGAVVNEAGPHVRIEGAVYQSTELFAWASARSQPAEEGATACKFGKCRILLW